MKKKHMKKKSEKMMKKHMKNNKELEIKESLGQSIVAIIQPFAHHNSIEHFVSQGIN
jgi:hypothetical protein